MGVVGQLTGRCGAAGDLAVTGAGLAGRVLAGGGGAALGAGFAGVARLRGDKALHAYGVVVPAELVVAGTGGAEPTGVPLLDQPGRHRCLLRLSRAASLSHAGPDVMGIALRVPGAGPAGADGDLLLATTGDGRFGRYVLAVKPRLGVGTYTTLLPMRVPDGRRLWLRVVPGECAPDDPAPGHPGEGGLPGRYAVSVALDAGPWRGVGEVLLGKPAGDADVHFAPIGAAPVGLTPPPWIVALREPAYRWGSAAADA